MNAKRILSLLLALMLLLSLGAPLAAADNAEIVQLKTNGRVDPLGEAECNTYPNLNGVGFAARPGESAVFEKYQIENAGKYARGVLFTEDIGATYAVFEGPDGLTVDGNTITVRAREAAVLAAADPSFGSMPTLRRSFEVSGELTKERLYITAQGVYDAALNGEAVAPDDWFNPGSTEYDSLLAYSVYDVTALLHEGGNELSAVLGESVEGSGSYLYDMGENLVGVPEITLPADYVNPGETLTIRYAETLYPELDEYVEQGVDGCLMVENLRLALATVFLR